MTLTFLTIALFCNHKSWYQLESKYYDLQYHNISDQLSIMKLIVFFFKFHKNKAQGIRKLFVAFFTDHTTIYISSSYIFKSKHFRRESWAIGPKIYKWPKRKGWHGSVAHLFLCVKIMHYSYHWPIVWFEITNCM